MLCTFTRLERLDVSNTDLSLSTMYTCSSTEETAHKGYSHKVSPKQEHSGLEASPSHLCQPSGQE